MPQEKNGFINLIDQLYISAHYAKPSRAHRNRGHKGYISIGMEFAGEPSTNAQLTVQEAADLIQILARAIKDYHQTNG